MRKPTSEKRKRAARLIPFLLLPLLLAVPGTAYATTLLEEENEYRDQFVSQCCNGESVEAGATEKVYFVLENVGTATWGAGPYSIDLGTEGQRPGKPEDYGEQLGDEFEAAWPKEERPTVGVATDVPREGTYKFAFPVKAPIVSSLTHFILRFGLVADGREPPKPSGWMDGDSGFGDTLSMELRVMPQAHPVATVSVSPETVAPGAPFTVTANASAVASVNHVKIQYGSEIVPLGPTRNPAIADDEQPQWSGSHTFIAQGEGPQPVFVTSYDDAGLESEHPGTALIDVIKPPQPPSSPPPLPKPKVVHPFEAGFSRAGGTREFVLTRLALSNVISNGEHVEVVCRGCSGRSKFGPVVAHHHEVVFHPKHLRVTARSQLTFYVTMPGFEGRYLTYSFGLHPKEAKKTAAKCLQAGTLTEIACPA